MPNILIAESFDLIPFKILVDKQLATLSENLDINSNKKDLLNFHYMPNLLPIDIEAHIQDFDALLVRPKEVTTKTIEQSNKLKLIIRGGAGVNTIAVDQASKQKIIVANTPDKNSIATAEFALLCMFELLAKRPLYQSVEDSRAGNPDSVDNYIGAELHGKKLGIVGFGNIGSKVAKVADALGMNVAYTSRTQKNVPFEFHNDIKSLIASNVDIVSLHVPLTDQTQNCFNNDVIHDAKKPFYLVNTARPQLVNINDFSQMLESNRLIAAAIDGDFHLVEPFIKADTSNRCLITHHIADSTYEAQYEIAKQAALQVKEFFLNNVIINQVNSF